MENHIRPQNRTAEVRQALESGQVTQKGTTTVHGTPAIALSIRVPDAQSVQLNLYVDERTYKPLRTMTVVDGNRRPYFAGWMPATRDNIAKARTITPSLPRRSTGPARTSYGRAVLPHPRE